MGFLFHFVNIMSYVDWLQNIKPTLDSLIFSIGFSEFFSLIPALILIIMFHFFCLF